MKHLTTYKLFESSMDDLHRIRDIYQDFLDKFGITEEYSHSKDSIGLYSPTNNKLGMGITHNNYFGEGFRVSFGCNLNIGNYKGFGGIRNDEIRIELEKAHKQCMDYFGFKDCLVGSSYVHSGGFGITYFTETPNYTFEEKPFSPDYLYGSDVYVRELPIVGGYVRCGIHGHPNMFDFYIKKGGYENIDGMFALYGGNPSRYYNPISITSGKDCDKYGFCIPNSPVEQWINDEWMKVARTNEIPVSKSSWNMTRLQRDGDISTIEFMDILVDNQGTFKNYKQLPKVNKDRR